MSGSNLSVRITADVIDLQTKFSIAKAEVAGLSVELNKLSRASAAGLIDPTAQARLTQVAGDFVAAKTQAAALGTALGTASGGVLGMTSRLNESHGSISTATREFRALFDELSSGRTRQTPGTIAILLQRVAGLSPAMLGAVGGVLGLAGGLGYLAYQANKAAGEINQIDITSRFAGNLSITRAAIQGYVEELSRASNVSSKEARAIVAAFAEVPGMTAAALGALTETISLYAKESGEDATKAADGLAKLFEAGTSVAEFAKKMGSVTQISQAQLDQAASADRSGNSSAVLAAKLSLLNQIVTAGAPEVTQYASAADDLAVALQAGESGSDQSELRTMLAQGEATAVDKATEARKAYIAAQAEEAPPADTTLKTGMAVAETDNPISKQIEDANTKLQKMEAALAVATDPAQVQLLNAALTQTNEKLQDLELGPALERMREQMGQLAATWDGTQSGMLAKQMEIAQAMLGNVQQGSRQELEIETEIARLEVEARRAASAQVIADVHQRIAEIGSIESQSALSRVAQEHAIWEGVLGDTRLTAAARIEVEREVAATESQIQRAAAAEQATIARQNVTANLSIARLQIEAEKSALDLGAAANAQAVAAKLAQLRELTAQEFELNNQALENELVGLEQSPTEYNRVYNEIREQKAKLVIDLENLDKQAAEASKKYAKEQSSDWKGIVGEIEGAESGFVSDILTKRKSLSQALLSVGAELVTKEIANDVKAITTRALLQDTAATEQRATEQGGVLYHMLTQQQQTASTIQSQSAQTTAVAAGSQARVVATSAAAAESKSAAAAVNGPTVMADAAKAFSGTYASVSSIPIVGWVMAPFAAAAAFAAVAAYEGMASLDVGAWEVPGDMTARIHAGETVMPKSFAEGYRENAEGGGEGVSEQHNYGGVHISAVDTRGFAALIKGPGNRQAIAQATQRYFARGGGRR